MQESGARNIALMSEMRWVSTVEAPGSVVLDSILQARVAHAKAADPRKIRRQTCAPHMTAEILALDPMLGGLD